MGEKVRRIRAFTVVAEVVAEAVVEEAEEDAIRQILFFFRVCCFNITNTALPIDLKLLLYL